jgi:hypothetical protein
MQQRLELGLPAVAVEGAPPLTASQQDELERGLIEACREVGLGLLRQGKLEEGWMYMRPVGDREATAEVLRPIPVDQDNLEVMIQLLVHEAIDVARGTELSLRMRGTCNTISMMESVVAMRGRPEQQAGVAVLVRHVHQELLESLKADLRRRHAAEPKGDSLEQLLGANAGLLRDGSYHIDTSHLASTVRFARVLDDKAILRLAVDLATYGKQLHSQYHYPGEEPFGDLYPASLAYFRALLGEGVDHALRFFLQRSEDLDPQEHGTVGIETYADLLARIGRPREAIQFLIRRMPAGMRPFGIAPSLLELSQQAGDFQPMLDHARQRLDVVGYAAALLQRTKGESCPAPTT